MSKKLVIYSIENDSKILADLIAGSNVTVSRDTHGNYIIESYQEFVDELVRVSSADTIAGLLSDKIVDGSGIEIEILNPGGNEQLLIKTDNFPFYKINIPDDLSAISGNEYYWETDLPYDEGIYDVHVFIGISERDASNLEVNVSLVQQLSIYDAESGDYRAIGASHLLGYTNPGGGDYKLINRSLQGSRIITLDNTNQKFKIMAFLPNHGGGGTGRITGGYIHAKRIQ
ncbi:hypothetical protein MASR1M45_12700 [Candidatus Kapaibacterium sp.]